MLLSDTTLKKYLSSGEIKILPEVNPKDIKSIGIRMHLGTDILIPQNNQVIDLGKSDQPNYDPFTMESSGYILKPRQFILGTTKERFQVRRDLVAFIDGRSTLARVGLSIHVTSQMADGNYDNASAITLEIQNVGPMDLILRPDMAIGILSFLTLTEPVSNEAEFLYKNQHTVLPPQMNGLN